MMRNNWLRILTAVLIIFAGCNNPFMTTETPSDSNKRHAQIYTNIGFSGEIHSEPNFNMSGRIYMSASGEKNSHFDNVSVRLYTESGDLITYECLGRLELTDDIEISLVVDGDPDYVIITSPDFWTKETVSDFEVDYFYRIDYNERTQYDPYLGYDPGRAFTRSDYPVDVTQHSPCT